MRFGPSVFLELLVLSSLSTHSAVAQGDTFAFHCRGNACRAVSFFYEGVGCFVVTNRSGSSVHVTQGLNGLAYDLGPGESRAPLLGERCYGSYDGGETANFIR